MDVVILGKGKSGKAAQNLLSQAGFNTFVYDDKEKTPIPSNPAFVVKSPGIPGTHHIIDRFKEKGIEIIGEVELGGKFLKGKVVCITGTNGKSTTTAFIYHALSKLHKGKVFIGGNYGIPVCKFAQETDKNSISVIEISSFQIEDLKDFRCNISTILNITPDHLNRYKTFDAYVKTKLKLIKHTKGKVIINKDDEQLKGREYSKFLTFSMKEAGDIFFTGKEVVISNEKIPANTFPISGYHNIQNIMASILICKEMGFSPGKFIKSIQDFKGLEHRLETVRVINGVTFINDSKSTNVDSLEKALLSFEKVILIAGGKDKSIDFSPLKPLIKKRVKKLITIGETAEALKSVFEKVTEAKICSSLKEAVVKAYENATEDDIVLFSPGCSSFDMFKNFEERGKIFKLIVEELK